MIEAESIDLRFQSLEELQKEAKAKGWNVFETQEKSFSGGRIYRWEKKLNCKALTLKIIKTFFLSLLIIPLFDPDFRKEWKTIFAGKEIKVVCLEEQPPPKTPPRSSTSPRNLKTPPPTRRAFIQTPLVDRRQPPPSTPAK